MGKRNKEFSRNFQINSLLAHNAYSLALLLLVPLICAVVFSWMSYTFYVNKEVEVKSQQYLDTVYNDVDQMLSTVQLNANNLAISTNVNAYLMDMNNKQMTYHNQDICERLRSILLSCDWLDSVEVFNVLSGTSLNSRLHLVQNKAEEIATLKDTMLGGRSWGYYLQQDRYSNSLIFLYAVQHSNVDGIIMAQINVKRMAEAIDVPEYVHFFVLSQGQIILADNYKQVGRDEQVVLETQEALGKDAVVHRQPLIHSRGTEAENLDIIVISQASMLREPVQPILISFVALIVLLLMIVAAIFFFVLRSMSMPFRRIYQAIEEKTVTEETEGFFKINELEMILKTIQESHQYTKNMEQELIDRLALLKKAQAVALQNQITPHFLNNTLETMRQIAERELGENNKIDRLCTALANCYRRSLGEANTLIPFSDEMDYLKNYMMIQQERYGDKFRVEWDIAPNVMEQRIIRMVIQPLVENAIYHGVKLLSDGGGVVSIRANIREGCVWVEVEDNGLGMTEEELAALRTRLKEEMIHENKHIGLVNVHQRVCLYYGQQYGVTVESIYGMGTKATLCFPLEDK